MTDHTPVTLSDVRDAMAAGDRQLGALVYWRGLSNVRVARDVFRTGFTVAGFGAAVGRDPKAEACLNQAAGIASRGQGRGVARARVELKAKGTHAVYAVLMRRDVPDATGGTRVRYLEEARIAVDRGQPSPTPTVTVATDAPADDARDQVIADVVTHYTDLLGNVLTQEMSQALQAAMDVAGALPLRPGVYFIPAASMERIRALQSFLTVHTDVVLTTWDIAATDVNASEAKRDAREAFLERVKTIGDEAREWVAGLAADEDPSAKSVNARVKRFKELEGQIQLYADILGDYQDELRAALADAQTAFRDAIVGKEIPDAA